MPEPSNSRTVAELLVEYLARAGVTDVFGVAGSTIMPILDAIADEERISYHGARHEQSAADMASGYARASGRLAVVMVHVGPGVTSAITTMVGAARDGVPLLLITGNEESQTLSRKPYHDWSLLSVMGDILDFSERVDDPADLPHIVRRAVGTATRATPQPVHIDLPEDTALLHVSDEDAQRWRRQVEPTLAALAAARTTPVSRPAPAPTDLTAAVDLITRAQRPVMVLGEAVRWQDRHTIAARCRDLGLPYATTHGGRGGDHDDEIFLGTIGRFGSDEATELVGEADLVIALGAELSDIDTVGWRIPADAASKVLVHPAADRIDLRYAPDLGVVADVGHFVSGLAERLRAGGHVVCEQWRHRVAGLRGCSAAGGVQVEDGQDRGALDRRLVTGVIEAAPSSWALCLDPGFGALTLSRAARSRTAPFLYPFGFGYMGFAVPNAVGAVHSDAADGALAVVGDGAFFMSMSSLESVASLDVPVVVVVLDDGGFGSQRKKQAEAYSRNVGVDYDNPDIVEIGRAMGLESCWIESDADVEQVCDGLGERTRGALAVVRRLREQQGTWYEGSAKRR